MLMSLGVGDGAERRALALATPLGERRGHVEPPTAVCKAYMALKGKRVLR